MRRNWLSGSWSVSPPFASGSRRAATATSPTTGEKTREIATRVRKRRRRARPPPRGKPTLPRTVPFANCRDDIARSACRISTLVGVEPRCRSGARHPRPCQEVTTTAVARSGRSTAARPRLPKHEATQNSLPVRTRRRRPTSVAALGLRRCCSGRVAAAPELAATRRPLREAKREPLIEGRDVRPRDCVPKHDPRPCLLEIDGSANGYDRHPGLSWAATMASAGRSVSTASGCGELRRRRVSW